MASDTPTDVDVRLNERTGGCWLEVDYEGLEPPLALFNDLRMIGWQPPAPSPPPRSALDWERPDDAAGTRFTVRPYRVVGARVEPPEGTGPRRSWTPGERSAHLGTLARVLDRHGLGPESAGQAQSAATAEEPGPAAAPIDSGDGTADEVVAFSAARTQVTHGDVTRPAAPPEPASGPEDQPAAPEVPEHGNPGAVPVGEDGLVGLEIVVPVSAARAVCSHLEAHGLAVSATATTVQVEGRYRGNTYVEDRPGARLHCDIPGAMFAEVLAEVCKVTGIPRLDNERLRIRRSSEAAHPAGATAAGGSEAGGADTTPGAAAEPPAAEPPAADQPAASDTRSRIRRGLRLVS